MPALAPFDEIIFYYIAQIFFFFFTNTIQKKMLQYIQLNF